MEFSWWLAQKKFQVLWVMKVDKKPLRIDALNNIFWTFIVTGPDFEVWNEICPQNSNLKNLKSLLLKKWILNDSKIFPFITLFWFQELWIVEFQLISWKYKEFQIFLTWVWRMKFGPNFKNQAFIKNTIYKQKTNITHHFWVFASKTFLTQLSWW